MDGPTDFVDFVRNIGRDETKHLGAGTYGFGKGVLYEASSCSTIVLFTRSTDAGKPVSRFMAVALGSAYARPEDGQRFTGRHWWGEPDATTGAEPVLGQAAEDLAANLGMTRIPRDGTGTALMVLAPKRDPGQNLRDVVARIAAAASWHAWPHDMGALTGGPSIDFGFDCDGDPVPLPARDKGVLRHYTSAYRLAQAFYRGDIEKGKHGPHTVTEIRSERPPRRLGVLVNRGFERAPKSPSNLLEAPPADLENSIALMRNPRFVVRYLEIGVPNSSAGAAGVFVVDPDLNDDFARSEPVTHDDWIPDNAQATKHKANPVRVALRKLRDEAKKTSTPPPLPGSEGLHAGVVGISELLGRFLGDATAADPGLSAAVGRGAPGEAGGKISSGSQHETGAPGNGAAARSGGSSARVSVVLDRRHRLVAGDSSGTEVEFGFRLSSSKRSRTVYVTAVPRVILDGSQAEPAENAPAGAMVPSVLGWRPAGNDHAFVAGSRLVVRPDDSAAWTVRILQPRDTAVTVVLDLEIAEDGVG
ncbi:MULTISPECIES: hypothetical protein [Pseudofrankia]|uniref:hypothetical protein n=1 Tax=Pseudofrankia TaxID=2994363 RepID=UPI0010422FAC|nr:MULTISPECIES: hypothetical protein [Pseudofrankia]